MNTYDIELPPLPEWIQEQMPCDTEYPVSTMATAMKQYAKVAIEAYQKRISNILDKRIEDAMRLSIMDPDGYYDALADGYFIADRIVKGETV